MTELVLSGLNGGNPLGFLAALGVFRLLSDAMPGHVQMSWRQESSGGWRPRLLISSEEKIWSDQWEVSGLLACLLEIPVRLPANEAFETIGKEEEHYRSKRNSLIEKEKSLKKEGKEEGLKGQHLLNYVQLKTNLDRQEVGRLRREWLTKLQSSALSPELGLGKTISVTSEEMREMVSKVAEDCSAGCRLVADLLAAFGSEICVKDGFIKYTPFCFVTGSGQQFFLETIQKLLSVTTIEHLHKTLFLIWRYDDARLSLRWDPIDDRRYALMWEDPTA